MSRSGLTSTFVEAVNAQETGEVFLVLLTIDEDGLSSPIRVTSDSVTTTSNGDDYVPFPFEIELPEDTDEMSSTLARLRIDAVDRRVIEAIRSISGVPTVEIKIVLASDPDTVEVSWPVFSLSNVRYGDTKVEGDLTLEVLDQEPYPGNKMDPGLFPGLF